MKKRVRIYKSGGNTGQYYNKTSQFLQRADEGMEIRNQESDMGIHDRVMNFITKSLQEGQLTRDEIIKTVVDQKLGYEEEIVTKIVDDVTAALQQQMMKQQQQAMVAQQSPQSMIPEEQMDDTGMEEDYAKVGGQKKPSRKKFIKDYLKKAQEGLQQVSTTNDVPLDGRETFKNNFIAGIKESVLKDQANKQFDLQNNSFAEEGGSQTQEGWAHSMHDYGEALSHMMPENTLTTARNGRQVSRDMRRINKDFQKMFGNMAVGYGNPGAMLPYGVSVINPLMNSGAFNIPEDKTTGNEKGEMINLPNMKVRAKRGWLGRLKEWEADINFGAIPANMMYGMQTGYPFQMSSYGQSFSPGVITTRKVAKAINNESIKEVANTTNSEAANNASISPAEKARQEAEKARQERLTEQSKDWMYEGAKESSIQNHWEGPVETKIYSEILNYLHPEGPFKETANEGYENEPDSFYKNIKDWKDSPFVKKSGTVDDPNTYINEDLVYSGPLSQNELNAKDKILDEEYKKYENMPEGPAKEKAWEKYMDLKQELGDPWRQASYITTDDEGNEYSSRELDEPNPKAAEMWRNYSISPLVFSNKDWIYNNRDLLFKQKGGTATPNYMTTADYENLLNQLRTEQENTSPYPNGVYNPRWDELSRLIPLYEDSLYNSEMKDIGKISEQRRKEGKPTAYEQYAGKGLDPVGGLKGMLGDYRNQLANARNTGNDDYYRFGNPLYVEDAGYQILQGADWVNEQLNKVNDYFGWSKLGFETGGQISQQDPNYGNPDLYKFVYGGIDPDGYPIVKDVNDPYFRNGGLYRYDGTQNSQVSGNTSGDDYNTWAKSRAEQAALDEYNAYMNRTNKEGVSNLVKYNANPNDLVYKQILAKHTGQSNDNRSSNLPQGQSNQQGNQGQGFQVGQYYPGNMGNFIPNYGREIAGSILGMPLGMLGARRGKYFTPDFNYLTQTGVPTVGGTPYYGQLDPSKISNIHAESKGRGLFRRPSTTLDISFNVPAGSSRPKLYTDASGNIKNANPTFSPNVGTTEKKEMSPMESVIQRETEGMSGKDLKTRTRDIKRAFKKGYGSDYMEDDSRNSTTYTQGTSPASSNNISGYTPNASGPGNSGYNADSDGNGIPDYLEVKNEPQSSLNIETGKPGFDLPTYSNKAPKPEININNPFAGNPDLQRFTDSPSDQLNIQSGTPGFDLPVSRQAPAAEFNISEGDAFEQRQIDKGLVWNEERRKWVPNEQNMNVINQAIDVMDPSYRSSQSDTRYIGGLPDDVNVVNQETTPFSFPNQSYLESGIQIPNEADMNSMDQIPEMEEPVGPVAPDYFSPEANEGFDPYFVNSPANRQQGAMQQRVNSQRPRQNTNQSRPANNSNNWNINDYKPKYSNNYTQGTSEAEMKKEDYDMNVTAKQNQIIAWRQKQLNNLQGLSPEQRQQKINQIMSMAQQMMDKVDGDYRARWKGVKKLGGLAKFQGPQNSQVQTGFKQTGMKCPMGAVKDPVTGFCKDISTGQMVQPISSLSVPSVDELTKNPFTNTASDPYKNPLTGESAAITNTNDGYKYTGEDLVDMGLPDDVAKARFKMNTAGTLNTGAIASDIFNMGMPMASNLLTTARNQRLENTYLGRQPGRTTYRDKRGQYSALTGRDALRPQEEGEIIVGQNSKFGGSKYKQGGVYNMSKQELMAFMAAGGQIEFL